MAYPWGGRVYALPPLFSLYLAPFARFASYPFNAFVGLAVLNALAIPLIVRLGTRLHSLTAGLVGGLLYACWGSDIVGLGQVRQEPLYLPLVIAATLAPGARVGSARRRFVRARRRGLRPGGAVPIDADLLRGRGGRRGRAARLAEGPDAREALALVGGFAALTLPYSLALSIHLGEPTLIENHGGILVASRYLHGGNRLAPPGFGRVAGAILQELATSPVTFIQVTLDQARSLLPLTGGRYLQDGVFAASASSAAALEGGGARVHRRAVAVRDRPGAAGRRGGAQPAGGVAARRVGAAQPRAHRADRLRRLAPPLPLRGARGAPRQRGGRRRLAQAAASARPRASASPDRSRPRC